MGSLTNLTFSSLSIYHNTLKKYGFVKQQDVEKVLLLSFLYDIVNDSDYFYTWNDETESFVINTELQTSANNQIKTISMCLNNHSCLINDIVNEVLEIKDPEGPTPPDLENPDVEFTFDRGISWYPARKLGLRYYEITFDEIPTIDMCGWRFVPDYTMFDFKIYSNGSWVAENYLGEESTRDRWNVYVGNDDTKYCYWHEVNSQGRPGRIYKEVKYRFKLMK